MTTSGTISRALSRVGRYVGLTGALVSLLLEPSCAYSNSVFQKYIMAQPSLPSPSRPFVLIFFSGASDAEPHYGFVTDGRMSRPDWSAVLRHVGYLSPYSIFKPKSSLTWSTHGQDTAVQAAQALGRPTGGSIMGLPTDRREWRILTKAYNDPLSLRMTHFFQDAEPRLGTPGGQGRYRAQFLPRAVASTLISPPTDAFYLRPAAGQLITVSFGAFFGQYAFGGKTVILGNRPDNHFNARGKGWYVAFRNVGGARGKNYVTFFSDGIAQVSSPPFSYDRAQQWNHIAVRVQPTADARKIKVTVAVTGVGSNTGIVPRPAPAGKRLIIGNPVGERHPVSYDDIVVTAHDRKGAHVVAHYTFEPHGLNPAKRAISRVIDTSGNKHDLRVHTSISANIRYEPTTGIDESVFHSVQRADVTELLDARRRHGLPAPVLLTGWRLNDRPGRFAAWKSAGFTNGSTEYYLYPTPGGSDKLVDILRRDSIRARWADTDGSRWNHAWLGQVHNDRATLTADQYQALVIMAVLDGYRWFSIFTAMSDGHLAPRTASRREQANANAAALYKMAEAASWFQSTSAGLRASHFLSAKAPGQSGANTVFRARINHLTKELWFAAYRPASPVTDEPGSLTVDLPEPAGTVVNLATGHKIPVRNGEYTLPLTGPVEPYYFHPASPPH